MTSLAHVYACLDNLTELYKIDVTAHYSNTSRDKKLAHRNPSRFSYILLSKKIFDEVPTNELADLFIALFDTCDLYCEIKQLSFVGNPLYRQSLLNLRELILNVIIPYQLPQGQKKQVSSDKDDIKKKTKHVQIQPRCKFTLSQAKLLFSRFLPINIGHEAKMWKQMKFILTRRLRSEETMELSEIAAEHVNNGQISFSALSYIMADPVLNKSLPPETILHALYIGPLRAQTVEEFASNRSPDFRKRCREMIERAGIAKKDALSHCKNRPPHIPPIYASDWSFMNFTKHTTQMIGELKGDKSQHSEINPGWAYSAIKKFGNRTYREKTYSSESFYDLIWTILAQRPNMKKFAVETLDKDFNDKDAASFWKMMNPLQMSRHRIKHPFVKEIDLLEPCEEFLNFPPEVKGITVVENEEQLGKLKDRIITDVLEKKMCIVGLDAEWSAFNGDSKATILQVALSNHIYIVDIESLELTHQQIRAFFNLLFPRKDIVKIGFQFGEDLFQMRNAVANCRCLYQPERVICVGRMISDLLDITEKRPDAEEIFQEIAPNFLNNDKLNDTVESIDAETEEKDISIQIDVDDEKNGETATPIITENGQPEPRALRVLSKGLSYLCEQVLGKPLDKMEQCSVWDRRPLRPLQVRYAAMDAYCLLMLYSVCEKWALKVGTTIEALVASQPSPHSSLPLFSDEH